MHIPLKKKYVFIDWYPQTYKCEEKNRLHSHYNSVRILLKIKFKYTHILI